MADVLAHPDKSWDWKGLWRKPTITIAGVLALQDGVLALHDKPWVWYALAINPAISIDDVLAHLDKPWKSESGWQGLSQNTSITWVDVREHLEKPWHWFSIGSNPGLFKHPPALLARKCAEVHAAIRIQRAWSQATYDPDYMMCIERNKRACNLRWPCPSAKRLRG